VLRYVNGATADAATRRGVSDNCPTLTFTPTMSPGKKRVKKIKIHVPRHNSQRIGPALTAQIEKIAKEKRLRTDVRQPTNEVSSAIAIAIVRPPPMLPVPARIDLYTRKVLPNGTRCCLLPAQSAVHSGMWVHSSRSFSQKTVITQS